MKNLSKSKLLAYLQCEKRLWLEVNHPEYRADSSATEASYRIGHHVGDIARVIYDPDKKGVLIDPQLHGFAHELKRSQALLKSRQPIFEAGFSAAGVIAFADIMLPVKSGRTWAWRMVEVKSSTRVKDYHRQDAAIQSHIARAAGVPLTGIAVAHINSDWVYPGKQDYHGLLVEQDLTEEVLASESKVNAWITDAQRIAQKRKEPEICTGRHCASPFACGFLAYCQSHEHQAEHPIDWLPGQLKSSLQNIIETKRLNELRDVPDDLLNETQKRVKAVTLTGKPFFDRQGAKQALSAHKLPAYFMDFETIQFAVPIWKGTRPYQQIPFQFSVHRLSRTGTLERNAFLDLSGKDPSKGFAEALIAASGVRGPVFVYNASFERSRIRELAERFPRLATPLLAINDRVIDLLPIARGFYYHPSQQGSWSIKKVLPAISRSLKYDNLNGVQDGGMAMGAYLEAISPQTTAIRKAEIEKQLLAYCERDTYGMVRMWVKFSGRKMIII